MPKTFTRIALNGPVMGTRWSAVFYSTDSDHSALQAALGDAVARVDAQMSTWQPDSDLMRFNRAPVGDWFAVQTEFLEVVQLGLAIGQASGGAFDIGMGDAVQAWGFGPAAPDRAAIIAAMAEQRRPAPQVIAVDEVTRQIKKRSAIALDLNGIAKGYAVDRMVAVLQQFGIAAGLCGLDGELRGFGLQPDGRPWRVAVERPDIGQRAAEAMLELHDASVATSGDYRHWVDVGDRRLSHTMDPLKGGPLPNSPASVTVLAETCAEADAWATAMMVLGPEAGSKLALRHGLSVLFLTRTVDGFQQAGVGAFA